MRPAAALLLLSFMASAPSSRATTPTAPPGRDVEIVGLDYAFQIPKTVAAGRTTFHLTNKGKVRHELNISLLKHGATVEQFMDAVRANKPTGELRDPVGVLFAEPGRRSGAGLTSELLAGRTYVVICILRDSAQALRHLAMGMYSVVVPTAAPLQPLSAARVDTIVATDYAFRYPRTLAAGHHSFALVNDGKVRHEVSIVLFKKGVTLQRVLDIQKSGADVDSLIEDGVGLLHSPAGTSPLGLLEMNLLAGREYGLVCSLRDDQKSPPHMALGMYGSISVSEATRR